MMFGDVSEDTCDDRRTTILADVGNSMVKLAVLSGVRQGMPCLEDHYNLDSHNFDCEGFENWLMTVASVSAEFHIASVYETAATRLETSVAAVSAARKLSVRKQRVLFSHLPIEVMTEDPGHVGIDRLAMLKYGITDLRSFFESDIRWLEFYGFDPLDVPTNYRGLSR
mgnify:CR=1 FL=1